MRYALLICTDENAAISPAERSWRDAALASFEDGMRSLGKLLGSERLGAAATATTVRAWEGGDVMVADGPFAETREQLAGMFFVECKDLDEAIQVALKVPAAWYGTVEIRSA
jgi:hypothetical protein